MSMFTHSCIHDDCRRWASDRAQAANGSVNIPIPSQDSSLQPLIEWVPAQSIHASPLSPTGVGVNDQFMSKGIHYHNTVSRHTFNIHLWHHDEQQATQQATKKLLISLQDHVDPFNRIHYHNTVLQYTFNITASNTKLFITIAGPCRDFQRISSWFDCCHTQTKICSQWCSRLSGKSTWWNDGSPNAKLSGLAGSKTFKSYLQHFPLFCQACGVQMLSMIVSCQNKHADWTILIRVVKVRTVSGSSVALLPALTVSFCCRTQ